MSRLIKSSDKLVCKSPAIYVSSQVFYDEELYTKATNQIRLIKKTLKYYKEFLPLPKGITFRLCLMRGPYQGYYLGKSKVLGLNVNIKDYLIVLSHELIHASQFYTKKLDIKKGVFYWHGSKFKNKGTTHKSYMQQPWEVEAFSGQSELTDKVLDRMIYK